MATSRKSFLTERLVASPDTDAYRPRYFRLANQPDADALTQLLHAHPEITVADVLLAQLQELIRTRHPTRQLQETDLLALVQAHMRGTALAEYGVWVYYPWSGRLVHLLDEPEFVELRTNRNKYKITPAEQALLAGKRIGIVGLSVGQSVAVTLALERGCGEIRLADFDRLELSNLNRIRTGVHNLGVPKVSITAREIAEIDPYLQVTCFPEGLTDANVDAFLFAGGKLDLLVEECDSLDVKIKLRSLAKAHRIPVVMDTSDRGLVDVERFDLEPERPIFHGLAGDVDPARLSGLSTEDKIPYVLDIIGAETVSPRLRASFVEIGQSLSSWPQLASAVFYGGAATCDVIRRINLGQMRNSGRYFVDVEQLIPNTAAEPAVSDAPEARVPPPLDDGYMITVAQTCAKHSTTARRDAARPSRQQIAAMVADAILAPSGGNCQPWRWLSHDGALYLFHDQDTLALVTGLSGDGEFRGARCSGGEPHPLGPSCWVRSAPPAFPAQHRARSGGQLPLPAPAHGQHRAPLVRCALRDAQDAPHQPSVFDPHAPQSRATRNFLCSGALDSRRAGRVYPVG